MFVTKAGALELDDKYIVGYIVRDSILWRGANGAIKRVFRPYICRYTSPNENFEYGNLSLSKTHLS